MAALTMSLLTKRSLLFGQLLASHIFRNRTALMRCPVIAKPVGVLSEQIRNMASKSKKSKGSKGSKGKKKSSKSKKGKSKKSKDSKRKKDKKDKSSGCGLKEFKVKRSKIKLEDLRGFKLRKLCKDEGPRCGPVRIAKSKCMKEKKSKKKQKRKSKYWALWQRKHCCEDPCADAPPRFDDLYYQASDKMKRKYRRTWPECPEMKVVRKPVCCFDKIKMPKYKKRKFKSARKGRKDCEPKKTELMSCRKTARKVACPKIVLWGCRAVRDPPKCLSTRVPLDCRKVCTPYPSFSECKHPPLRRGKIVECRCLDLVPICEVYAELRRLGRGNKTKKC